MKSSTIQSLLARNRVNITELQQMVYFQRLSKRSADEHGFLDEEYIWHNELQRCKNELRKLVKIQCELKQELKKA